MSDQGFEEMSSGGIPLSTRNPNANMEVFDVRVSAERLVAKIMRDMAGVVVQVNADGDTVFIQTPYQLVNMKGARMLYNWFSTSFNSITSLTGWTQEEILLTLEHNVEDFIHYIVEQNIEMGLDWHNEAGLVTGYRTLLHAQLNKAKDYMENKQVSAVQTRIHQEQVITQKDANSSGFSIPRFGGGDPRNNTYQGMGR